MQQGFLLCVLNVGVVRVQFPSQNSPIPESELGIRTALKDERVGFQFISSIEVADLQPTEQSSREEETKVTTKVAKNASGPIYSQCLVYLLWAAVETW